MIPVMTPAKRCRTLAYPILVAVTADFFLGGTALCAKGGWTPVALVYLTLWAILFRFAFTEASSREKWAGVPFMTLGLYGAMQFMSRLNLYEPDSIWWAFGGTFVSVIVASWIGERFVRKATSSLPPSDPEEAL